MILKVIENKKCEFMVKDIYDELNGKVGLTTIYRLVDKLVMENILNKFISFDNNTYYQYLKRCDAENHFFLRCDKCGNLVHVDCDCIGDLFEHIIKKHNFCPSKEHIIINGVCKNCIG